MRVPSLYCDTVWRRRRCTAHSNRSADSRRQQQSDRREHATDMEPSPAARPQPLRELPREQGQNDRKTTDIASSEPCGYIDDVAATVAEKMTAATVVDRLETTTEVTAVVENNPTAMRTAAENNPTAMRAADESNPTVMTAADEEVTAAAAPATLQITTDEVTATARVSEVSFVRKFKRFFL